MKDGLAKFVRYAENVWNVNPEGKTDEEIAEEGLVEMGKFMQEIGVAMKASEVGVTEENIRGIAEHTLIMDGGYKVLNADDIEKILRESM